MTRRCLAVCAYVVPALALLVLMLHVRPHVPRPSDAASMARLAAAGAPSTHDAPTISGSAGSVPEKSTIGVGAPVAVSIEVARLDASGGLLIAGRAPVNSSLVLWDAAHEAIGETVADARGDWVFLSDQAPAEGLRLIKIATATHAQTGCLVFARPPAPADALALLVPCDGRGTSRLLQRPYQHAARDDLTIDTIDFFAGALTALAGRAAPGRVVELNANGAVIARTTAGAQGIWSIGGSLLLAGGGVSGAAPVITLRDDDGKSVAERRLAVPRMAAAGAGHDVALEIDQAGIAVRRVLPSGLVAITLVPSPGATVIAGGEKRAALAALAAERE